MEVSVTFNDQTRDSLTVLKNLSQGGLSVYQVFSRAQNTHFAMKVFPRNSFGDSQYQNEKQMFKLAHENVVRCFPITCSHQGFQAVLTEFCHQGDFFDLVLKGFLTSEVLVRTYFHQLIEGLEYIHSQGIAHLDLKLENLMLGADYKLKIIDFDHAQLMTDKEFKNKGTVSYRAPEIKDETCKNAAAADVFSAGILLYSFKAKEFPFVEREDPTLQNVNCYSTFVKNNGRFWEKKNELKKNGGFFTADFVELVNGMLEKNPEKRLSIKDIKETRWYKGPVLDSQSLKAEMKAKFYN